MSIEQAVLEIMRALSSTQQQEVLDFAEFLRQKSQKVNQDHFDAEIQSSLEQSNKSISPLGQRLRAIRQRAIESGMKLMSVEEIEQEIAQQRHHQHYYDDENLS